MIKSLNHIGIAVKDLQHSVETFKKIFEFDEIHCETVESQHVRIASFKVGEITIELTAPTSPESPITKFIEKKGGGLHHIAFATDGICEELSRLKESHVGLIDETPQPGAHNMSIAFLHPKSTDGVLIELCQDKQL